MIDPIVKENRVVFGPCRLSYAHLFEKWQPDNAAGDAKYMTNVLIPKSEKKTIKTLQEAIEATAKAGAAKFKNGKVPAKYDSPLRDGDDKEDELYQDHYYMNPKSSSRPSVVDKNNQPIMDPEEMYSGVWAYISVSFFVYNVSGNQGVGCFLNSVRKFKDDERLGGNGNGADDFASIIEDDDDL